MQKIKDLINLKVLHFCPYFFLHTVYVYVRKLATKVKSPLKYLEIKKFSLQKMIVGLTLKK